MCNPVGISVLRGGEAITIDYLGDGRILGLGAVKGKYSLQDGKIPGNRFCLLMGGAYRDGMACDMADMEAMYHLVHPEESHV